MNITIPVSHEGNHYELTAKLIKSNRRSVGIAVKPGGEITVRAPRLMPQSLIMAYIREKESWIIRSYLKQCTLQPASAPEAKTPQALALEKRYLDAARDYIPKRVAYYQAFTGGSYQKITIRDQKTRWGSCSSNGTLSFSFRLMMAPPLVLDYVVVHELCHLTHMNHSKEFWNMVESILPDYKEHRKWLKENGHTLHTYCE